MSVVSKLGRSDESLPLDSSYLAPLQVFFNRLYVSRQDDDRLWDMTYNEFSTTFKRIVSTCRLRLSNSCLYTLRHGGASHDSLHDLRSLASIKERGRWVTDASLVRYKKATRAQRELHLMDDATTQFGQLIANNLEEFFHFPSRVHGHWRRLCSRAA